jgi:hypothetical protein
MSRLEPCPSCGRHVRLVESACPFCQAPLSLSELPPRALPGRRMSRAASFAFGAGVVGATTLVACSDGQEEALSVMPVYGAPAAGTSNEGPKPEDGQGGQGGVPSEEPPGGFAVYGSPPGGDGAL